MNRIGLVIALVLALVSGVLFGLYPEWDLKIAALFYDVAAKAFPLKLNTLAMFARDAAMWIAWALVGPAIVALVWKLVRPVKPLIIPGRAMLFLLSTMIVSSILLSNAVFKTYWGRPRPVVITQFGGAMEFVPWWDPRGKCPKNCSFFSGEGAAAFWTYAPAALTPPAWRPLAYVGATAFGAATGGLRMAFGGHFMTDVVAAALVSFIVVWLAFALIYRWPSTRITDYDVDAWLTRAAWPGYRWLQKRMGREIGASPRLLGAADTNAPIGGELSDRARAPG